MREKKRRSRPRARDRPRGGARDSHAPPRSPRGARAADIVVRAPWVVRTALAALAALATLALARQLLWRSSSSASSSTPPSSMSTSSSMSSMPSMPSPALRGGDANGGDENLGDGTPRALPGKLLSVAEVQALARGRDGWSCEEVIRAYLKRLRGKRASVFKAVVEVRPQVDILREARSRETDGALFCVPTIVKDNIDIKGMVSAAGSIAMENLGRPAGAHAPAIARLVDAGAVVLGHANMDEFALGFRTSSSRGGQTLNAFDKTRYPGGSSGGTAVAVALGLAVIGVGTDTGGSVRIPASFAGLYGIRPSTGAVPVEGVVPLSHSRDTVGFMATAAGDVDLALAVASGRPRCAAGESASLRVGLLPMLSATESGLKRAFADALAQASSRAASRGSREVTFVTLSAGATLDEVSRLVAQLSKQKSTSYFEFQDDLRKATGLNLAEIAAATGASCQERLDASECASVVATIEKKIHGKLRKRETETYEMLTRTFPALFQAALVAMMRAERVDAVAYPTFKKLPSRISSGKQLYCANNRLAPAVGWPALTLPLATFDGLPQGVEVMAPKDRECVLFDIASAVSA